MNNLSEIKESLFSYKNILIILVLIGLVAYLNQDKIEKFGQNLKTLNALRNSSSQIEDDEVYEVGVDDSNQSIYKYKNNTFKITPDNYFEAYEPKEVKYLDVAVRIPSVITTKSIKAKVPPRLEGFKFKGVVNNKYYKQYFALYEKEYENYDMEEKLFEYLLVKKIDEDYKIIHRIPPRPKVEPGDSMYFSYGNFQLGPLKFI